MKIFRFEKENTDWWRSAFLGVCAIHLRNKFNNVGWKINCFILYCRLLSFIRLTDVCIRSHPIWNQNSIWILNLLLLLPSLWASSSPSSSSPSMFISRDCCYWRECAEHVRSLSVITLGTTWQTAIAIVWLHDSEWKRKSYTRFCTFWTWTKHKHSIQCDSTWCSHLN